MADRPEVSLDEQIAVQKQLLNYYENAQEQRTSAAILASLLELQKIKSGNTCEEEGCPQYGTPHAHVEGIRTAERPEPVAFFAGRRLTPEGTPEFYGYLNGDIHLENGEKLYGPEVLAYADRMRAERDTANVRVREFDSCIQKVAAALGACCGGVDGDQTEQGATTRVLLEAVANLHGRLAEAKDEAKLQHEKNVEIYGRLCRAESSLASAGRDNK